ncbi:MAG TPA: vitamin K epoxide reductase family protein [Clostridia bacterium]|nr:vitamin K epoxide reductase family protein [Clostridia bacterium]
MNRLRALSWTIFFFAVAGIILSAISLVSHYSHSTTEFCSIDETFNCDLVNRSIYSSFLGVPVALIGLLGYGFILTLARIAPWNKGISIALFASALAGLGFSLYLTYVEAYILGVWCILCLGSLGVIVVITVLSGAALARLLFGRTSDEVAASQARHSVRS